MTLPLTDTRPRWAMIASITAKLLLAGLLLSALIWPDLSGIKGKASTARLIVYPLGAMALPIIWYAARRFRAHGARNASYDGLGARAFPWVADLLLTLPWLVDLAGNRLDLFDTVGWWDDAMHFVLWGFLTAGVLVAFPLRNASRALTTMVALGFGTTAALIWELGEFVAFVRHSPELQTAYTDTLGDLAFGTLGALLAGLTIAQLNRPKNP